MSKPTNPATVKLTNWHGFYEVDAAVLDRAISATASMTLTQVKIDAAVACGYEGYFDGNIADVFDGDPRIAILIAWVESGNHVF